MDISQLVKKTEWIVLPLWLMYMYHYLCSSDYPCMVYSIGMCVFKQQIKSVGMQVKHKNNVYQYTFYKGWIGS